MIFHDDEADATPEQIAWGEAFAALPDHAARAVAQGLDDAAVRAAVQAAAPKDVTIRVSRRRGRLRVRAMQGSWSLGVIYAEPAQRGRGRPRAEGSARALLSERVTEAQLHALDALAARKGVMRGALVRLWAGEVERGEWGGGKGDDGDGGAAQ